MCGGLLLAAAGDRGGLDGSPLFSCLKIFSTDEAESVQGYIKRLIRADIADKGE